MHNSSHRRLPTSDSINLPMITTKSLQHPFTKQLSSQIKQLNSKTNSIYTGTLPSTTSISRRSSQLSIKQTFAKQKSIVTNKKVVPFQENQIVLNITKKKPSVCEEKRKRKGKSVQKVGKSVVKKDENFDIEKEFNNPFNQFQLKTETNILKHPDLEFLFNKPQAQISKPYHLDGDLNMYTQEAIDQRSNLKELQAVKISINRFIDDCFELDKYQQLLKMNYLSAFLKISLILRDDLIKKEEQDYTELKQIMEEDWKHDSKGKNKMTRADLQDALFELADIWTPGIDSSQLQIKFLFKQYVDIFHFLRR